MTLLSNKGYFARYGEHLTRTRDSKKAYEATEGDLSKETDGFRRFFTYQSFKVSFGKFQKGILSENIILKKK